jgi:hypothetical protein
MDTLDQMGQMGVKNSAITHGSVPETFATNHSNPNTGSASTNITKMEKKSNENVENRYHALT